MRRLLLLLGAMSLAVWGAQTDELIARAQAEKLSDARYWHLLLHAPNEESEIDDPAFFLDPEGKTDPEAELESTIRRLNEDANRSDGSPFCRFPARRAWLENSLGTSFGTGECRAYDTLVAKMDPQRVTLVFPSAHINSPASMFGHTFLRIDSSMESRLMSYAVNYAAHSEEKNGLVFAYKGIFGGYSGFYSVLPYYEKLKEYRDSESRDVWEYDLNLTRDEVMAMVRHIWELQGIRSDYYFFDENCSYHMLWLTEIARPRVRLREHFTYYVIPPETVRAFEAEGLVGAKHYRPSKRTKLLAYEHRLSTEGVAAARSLAAGETAPEGLERLGEQEQRFVFEAAAELVEHDYIAGELSKETYAKRYHALLSRRSALGKGEMLNVTVKENPDSAHPAARVEAGWGHFDKRSALLIGWRPAFHDLDEYDAGHLSGAQIEFLDTQIGLGEGEVHLEKLTLLSLASIVPVGSFFRPFSWRMKAGWDREYGTDASSFVLRAGAGAAIGGDRFYAYVLGEPEIRAGFRRDAGIGAAAGGVAEWGGGMKSRIEWGILGYLDVPHREYWRASQVWQWSPRSNVALHYERSEQEEREERLQIGISLYF